MYRTWGLLIAFSLIACSNPSQEPQVPNLQPTQRVDEVAEMIVAGAIRFSDVHRLDSALASFKFREASYGVERYGARFSYTRRQIDSTGAQVVDILDNVGLTRTVDGEEVQLSQKRAGAYSESVNSVIYFAFLPLALQDDAVQATYEGPDSLAGRPYHRVHVAFGQEGGGNDFEDEFLYWFDAEDLSLDFLAYSYATDGGGVRFREAFNVRQVGGVRVQDYRNFRAEPELSLPLDAMAEAWRNEELVLLSLIELEDVRIEPVTN